MEQPVNTTKTTHEAPFSRLKAEIQENVQACMQCGTCSGSLYQILLPWILPPARCGGWPRLGEIERDHSRARPSTCARPAITAPCDVPRGLPLTEMHECPEETWPRPRGLRREYKQSSNFYQDLHADTCTALRSAVREMEFINRYFLSMKKSPLFPVSSRVHPVGDETHEKRKGIPGEHPNFSERGRFDRLFKQSGGTGELKNEIYLLSGLLA